mgnify:CR=1 FL=1
MTAPKVLISDALSPAAVQIFKDRGIEANQHFTQPPPRYSEASLVKKLEELGIGRPSTYASIIEVLQRRNYVRIDRKRFIPEDRGRIVTAFLVALGVWAISPLADGTSAINEPLLRVAVVQGLGVHQAAAALTEHQVHREHVGLLEQLLLADIGHSGLGGALAAEEPGGVAGGDLGERRRQPVGHRLELGDRRGLRLAGRTAAQRAARSTDDPLPADHGLGGGLPAEKRSPCSDL